MALALIDQMQDNVRGGLVSCSCPRGFGLSTCQPTDQSTFTRSCKRHGEFSQIEMFNLKTLKNKSYLTFKYELFDFLTHTISLKLKKIVSYTYKFRLNMLI